MPVRTDYILRLIQQLAQLVARVMGLRRAGRHDEALAALDAGATQLFGFPIRVALALGTPDLIALLKDKYGSTLRSAAVLAELLIQSGDVRVEQGTGPLATLSYRRALSLLLGAAATPEPPADDLAEASRQVGELRRRLGDAALPSEELASAARLHERAGHFAPAEDAHFALVRREPDGAGADARAFYDRLRSLSDDELARGGLPRDEVEEGRRALAAALERP